MVRLTLVRHHASCTNFVVLFRGPTQKSLDTFMFNLQYLHIDILAESLLYKVCFIFLVFNYIVFNYIVCIVNSLL